MAKDDITNAIKRPLAPELWCFDSKESALCHEWFRIAYRFNPGDKVLQREARAIWVLEAIRAELYE